MMHTRPLVFIDIETTGAAAWNSRMLEIGALRVEDGQVVERYSQVLDPGEPVPPFITRLTGIEPHETDGMPGFIDVLPKLRELFDGALFIAHNVSFDYGFFKEECKRAGMAFNMDRLCTVRLSRALYPEHRSHRLDAIIQRHGYSVLNRHRAYDDAEVLHKFYRDSEARFGLAHFHVTVNRLIQRTNLQTF